MTIWISEEIHLWINKQTKDEEFRADITILCDGVNSLLARKYNLIKDLDKKNVILFNIMWIWKVPIFINNLYYIINHKEKDMEKLLARDFKHILAAAISLFMN